MINWREKWMQVIRNRLRTHFNMLVFLLVVGLSVVLCFCGLGKRTLWQDEGETAVLAQRVLIYGTPRAMDGYNLVYQDWGGHYQFDKEYRWIYHPWGQFYLTAVSFAVLGQTNFAARFPFAVCGVLTVALLYIFVWRHWRSLTAAALSALLLATSTAFVLHCRQCRYYGLSALTCLSVVIIFVELMKQPWRRWWVMFGVALAAQFYTDFGTLIVILPALAISLWPMGARKKEIIAAAKGFALAVFIMMPGLIFHWHRLTAAGSSWHIFLQTLPVNIYYFDNWFAPLIFLLPAGVLFVWRIVKSERQLSEQDRIIITCIIVMGTTLVGMSWAAPCPYIRYLIPSISLVKLVLAVIFIKSYVLLRERGLSVFPARMVVISGILFLIFSNGFSLATQYLASKNQDNYKVLDFCTKTKPSVRSEFTGLLYEITNDFVCADRVAVNAVDDLAEAGEKVAIDYSTLVLMFYRPDLRVYFVSELPNQPEQPDMIITYHNPDSVDIQGWLKKYHYYSCTLKVPVSTRAGSIPEPTQHWFATDSARFYYWIYLREDHKDRMLRLPQTAEGLEARWFRRR